MVAFTCAVQMMVISNKISKKGPRTPAAQTMISSKTQKPLFSGISWIDGPPNQETQLNPLSTIWTQGRP